ncbi:MAG TPA: hypothetical protein ENI53_00020 [Thermoplasmatales archaeon]|nr:hypothetical protein [Thermoplasmatales archaeon]
MKGKIAYKKGRLGKVHFQKNRGNVAMHFSLVRNKPPSPAQQQQRQVFKQSALSYRQLTAQQRENLRLWGAMRNDLISGYDWWTKAKLTNIIMQKMIDRDDSHNIPILNADLQNGGLDFTNFVISENGEGYVKVVWLDDDLNLQWQREYFEYNKIARDMARMGNDKILVVGDYGRAFIRQNGQWTGINTGTLEKLIACDVLNENIAWIVGYKGNAIKYKNGSCEHYNFDENKEANSLCIISEDEIAVGTNDDKLLIWNGNEWSEHSTPGFFAITGIYGASLNDMWACGWINKLAHWNGNEWDEVIDMGNGHNFYKIKGTSMSNIYALTDQGEVYHYDGNEWSLFASLDDDIRDIDILPNGEIYIVKENGQVYRYYNSNWIKYGSPLNDVTYTTMAVNEYGDVFIAGYNFFIKQARFNRRAELYGGNPGGDYGKLEMEDFYNIRICEGATIEYGAKVKRVSLTAPLPKIYITMLGDDNSIYTNEFRPVVSDLEWHLKTKQTTAPANIKGIKIGVKAENVEIAEHAYIDEFQIYAEGRFLVVKCEHPLLERVMITNEDGSIIYYDSNW